MKAPARRSSGRAGYSRQTEKVRNNRNAGSSGFVGSIGCNESAEGAQFRLWQLGNLEKPAGSSQTGVLT